MREDLLDILACPHCRAPFRLRAGQSDEAGGVESGELSCTGQEHTFPIRSGIPRLLVTGERGDDGDRADKTRAHFEMEFSALDLVEGDADISSGKDVEYYFYSRTGIDPKLYGAMPGNFYRTEIDDSSDSYQADGSFLNGKMVLDAGCGPGRFTVVAAGHAKRVIGLEFGAHVDRAAGRCGRLPNTDFVQGSVLEPPFAAETFDYVFTVGVLHHTPDPRQACLRLADLVRRGGAMSVWVYPPNYWGDPLRGWISRRIHARMKELPPRRALDVCAKWLYPLGRVQALLAQRRWTKLLGAPLFLVPVPRHPRREVMISTIYDRFGPPIIRTHGYEEVAEWLRRAGFEELRQLPVPTAWFADKRTPLLAAAGT